MTTSALFVGALMGDVPMCRRYAGDVMCMTQPLRETPLFIACREGHADAVRVLMDAGSDVNHANAEQCTCLGIAVMRGHVGVVHALLSHSDLDVNKKIFGGWTPFLVACHYDRLDIAQILYLHGADTSVRVGDGWTAFHSAAKQGSRPLMQLLLSINAAHMDAASPTLGTPLQYACFFGMYEVARLLADHGADVHSKHPVTKRTCLHSACATGDAGVVDFMLRTCPGDVEVVDAQNATPLYTAVANMCFFAARKLVECGARADAPCTDGRTPVHAAAALGRLDMLRVLRAPNAVQDAINGDTPLHLALRQDRDRAELCAWLCRNKEDLFIRNHRQETPLWLCASHGIRTPFHTWECCVCLEDDVPTASTLVTACGHCMCRTCAESWLARQEEVAAAMTCPSCRRVLDPSYSILYLRG